MNCTSCGNENAPGNRYCGMCGRELSRPISGRERRRVTVVFVDLAKFSTITIATRASGTKPSGPNARPLGP